MLEVADRAAKELEVRRSIVGSSKRQGVDCHDLHRCRAVIEQENPRADSTVIPTIPASVDNRIRRAIAGDRQRGRKGHFAAGQHNRICRSIGKVCAAHR